MFTRLLGKSGGLTVARSLRSLVSLRVGRPHGGPTGAFHLRLVYVTVGRGICGVEVIELLLVPVLFQVPPSEYPWMVLRLKPARVNHVSPDLAGKHVVRMFR